ncbi:MAG TPA: tetratricopeptide repeat protein [Sphingomicrobium sp.]
MAQPPDISDTFVREVDENLRRDRLRDIAKNYSGWIIAAVVLFLGASGGYIYWQDYQRKQNEKAVEQLAQVFTDVSKGQLQTAPARLDTLSKDHSKGVRASAGFGRAALAIEQNDPKLAITKFRAMAEDKSLPKPFRDLALIRQTALEFDRLKPDEIIARMQPLTKPGAPWFGSAGELTAMALIKQGKTAEAGRLFAAIARDEQAPEPLRGRAVQMASSLGVDVSNVMPKPAQ